MLVVTASRSARTSSSATPREPARSPSTSGRACDGPRTRFSSSKPCRRGRRARRRLTSSAPKASSTDHHPRPRRRARHHAHRVLPRRASREEAYEALRGSSRCAAGNSSGDAWRDAWKEHWRPTRSPARVVVVPSWTTYDPQPGDLVLPLDLGAPSTPASTLHRPRRPRHRARHRNGRARRSSTSAAARILRSSPVMQGLPRARSPTLPTTSPSSPPVMERNSPPTALTSTSAASDVVPETSPSSSPTSRPPCSSRTPPRSPRTSAAGARLSGILVEQRDDVVQPTRPSASPRPRRRRGRLGSTLEPAA